MAALSRTSLLVALLSFLCLCDRVSAAEPTLSLGLCPLNATEFIGHSNITWGSVSNLPIRELGGSSYLRPDVGGALLPWLYTIIVIIAHIPIVVVRVVRWQKAQTWCLAATALTLAVTLQGYKSTVFAPEMILTWNPLLLIIDAGSMAQVLFLIEEDRHLLSRLGRAVWPSRREERGTLLGSNAPERFREEFWSQQGYKPDETSTVEEMDIGTNPRRSVQGSVSIANQSVFKDDALYAALGALGMLIAVFVLQIVGLTHAVSGVNGPTPLVKFCTPVFQPFGLALLDGNCNIYTIDQNFIKGVGCIFTPGNRQMLWLKLTVVGTILALILQVVDICLLAMVHTKTRWRGIKMRRPWCSMVGGLGVLGVLLIFGLNYAANLPPEVSERIWIVQVVDEPSIWATDLVPAGLRGAILGWNDGIFNSWNTTYYGGSIVTSVS